MRGRIVGVALLSAALSLLLFLVPLAVTLYNLVVADAYNQLQREALTTAVAIDPAFSSGDTPEIPPAAQGNQLGLYSASGERVGGTGPAHGDQSVTEALAGSSHQAMGDGWVVVAVPIGSAETVAGVVRAAMPVADLLGRAVLGWLTMLAAALLCLLVGVLIARALAKRLAARLDTLTALSDELGEGRFEARATPSGVPEIDRVGEALNLTAERLEALVERERRISENASHQLRTPLAGLRALLENAVIDPDADPRAAIGQAIERADRLEETIDEFVTLNRGLVRGELTDPGTILDEAGSRWHGILAAAGRPLRIDVEAELQPIVVVVPAVRQILDALIDNALRHGRGVVTIRARESHGAVAFDVEDEGTIVEPEETLFARGLSTDGSSGLGLALARDLADDNGGRLMFSVRQPHTRFTILFAR